MDSHFPGVFWLAILVSFVFMGCLAFGIFMFVVLGQPVQMREGFLRLMPDSAIITVAGLMSLYGVIGLLMAGAVRVLIAIEQNTSEIIGHLNTRATANEAGAE